MSTISRFVDSLSNVVTGLGTRNDARTARRYNANVMTREGVESAYRGSGMLRKAIGIPALDMVREWRDWQAEADQIEALEAEERRLQVPARIKHAEILRSLGGGAIIIGAPGDAAMPINAASIRKGGVAYLKVVSRWSLSLGDLVEDPNDLLYGEPSFFKLQGQGREYRLHPSRVVPFRGEPLPALIGANAEDLYWGESRIPALHDAALNLDEALASFAALIKDARNIDIGVSGLLDIVATEEGEARLLKRLNLMVQGAGIINANVFDKGDAEGKGGESIERHQVTWTGIPQMIRAFAEALCAVSDIPMTRFWGTAPEGMNSSGSSQQIDWDKAIRARQNLELRPCLDQLDAALIPSALDSSPAELWWQFAPLAMPTEAEEATRFKTTMEAMEKAQQMGFIPDVAFTKAGQNLISESGWLPGLDGALAELDQDTRFGITSGEDDGTNPSELTQLTRGGDPSNLATGGEDGSQAAGRRAANDKKSEE